MNIEVRKSVQAGKFYPGARDALEANLKELFDSCAHSECDREPKGLVAPHAGYQYSGGTAAHAYKMIEKKGYSLVVIVAPSHYAYFDGASIYGGKAYETPLGRIPIAESLISKLKSKHTFFSFVPSAHTHEHSLEVQLPFLQYSLEDFEIVPLIISNQGFANVKQIAQALVEELPDDRKTLFVASSDLYHGPSNKRCKESDRKLIERVESFDIEGIVRGNERREFMACGYGPIAVVMLASKLRGASEVMIVDHTTSYDVQPTSEDYVVGYFGCVFC